MNMNRMKLCIEFQQLLLFESIVTLKGVKITRKEEDVIYLDCFSDSILKVIEF